MLSNIIATSMLNPEIFKRENVKRFIRDVGEKEVRVLMQLIKNQKKIFELQKQLLIAQRKDTKKRRREKDREQVRRDYNKKQKEKE